jgi:hypothetical protein
MWGAIYYTLGFMSLEFAQAYVQTVVPEEIIGSEWASIFLRSYVVGVNDTAKFAYWDGFDKFKK